MAPPNVVEPQWAKRDACGVGFIVQIKGKPSHKILSDAKHLLCNMTHRGATGADARDGDGAGVMCGIPHEFFARELLQQGVRLPQKQHYAAGNVFFHPDRVEQQKIAFEEIADRYQLRVLAWRNVPVDNSILGPVAKSKEPKILQPFVVLKGAVFESRLFEKQLYLLRKTAAREIGVKEWFYICSLSTHNVTYKGQLSPVQVYDYYLDLGNANFETHFALVHSRFSTNTFPSWNRAQPLRFCAHNGEINTLRGNKNWMRAREGIMKSTFFKNELEQLYPIIEDGGSDSAALDNVLELLLINGTISLPEVVMMLVPEAWQNNPNMNPDIKAFYQWAACLMEPWDGPALFTFSDGRYCGASLDRNGLRPCRYYITKDDRMICASEVGTMVIDPETIVQKGRLKPGRMLLVDTVRGTLVDDNTLKLEVANRQSFGKWIEDRQFSLESIHEWYQHSGKLQPFQPDDLDIKDDHQLRVFGLTLEQLNFIIIPMAKDAKEALGSMGNDGPLACLSVQPRSIFEYFRQLFAQVTNPPIDPIREEIVMSLECYVGPEGNILEIDENQCNKLLLKSPLLDIDELESIKNIHGYKSDWSVEVISILFPKQEGVAGYRNTITRVCNEVAKAIDNGVKIIILSDQGVNKYLAPISSLIAVGAVHQYLIANKQRSKIALFVDSGEAREVHHFCVLIGYGADAICPRLAISSILKLKRDNLVGQEVTPDVLIKKYIKAANNGILKVMSKMGISTLQSYKGAQIFEALGIGEELISKAFSGTASRIKGATIETFAEDALKQHESGFPSRETIAFNGIPELGEYQWRKGGEKHLNEPSAIALLQDAVRTKNENAYAAYSKDAQNQVKDCTLRGLLDFDFDKATPVPIDEVEPWTEIVKRFVTGAMSYGSISYETHTALAAAMNELGGKSNTGEGGEDVRRSQGPVNGQNLRSAIKQVASGRFGVTSFYLSDSDEIQIKMAQGAKPGEGGELPGHKVTDGIAATRKSTPGVGLISPPPHHDIYSIEDLKQLIYDLKTANPRARVSVKLVSEVGVGVIASGVAKARADHILISGHDGGTGASRWTGIKYAGLPWELGLAETHQTLVLNDLRGRVIVQTDGQIKTGRDVVIACLLGAEEWGFATTPLIALGCIMMRKCHLNTCPVGIATQDPELRAKFVGQPEHVINFFYYVAEEARSLMAQLGFRSINEMVGRSDLLKQNIPKDHPKAQNLDLTPILTPAFTLRRNVATYCVAKQDHKLHVRMDNKFLSEAEQALEKLVPTTLKGTIVNTDRTLGSTLSYHISRKYGEKGLPDGTININLVGSAGQSFGAFLAKGIFLELEGDANDYVGKGLSGGTIAVFPNKVSTFQPEKNVIAGNVCLYGASSGKLFLSGIAAERFAVRNSGALAVVEGVGDHGCEYMTGGRVIILGTTGRNFAAGMSGGIAYVLWNEKEFAEQVNPEMVDLETINEDDEIKFVKDLITEHVKYTGSPLGKRILDDFNHFLPQFVRVMPREYRKVLEAQKAAEKKAITPPAEPIKHKHDSGLADIEDAPIDALEKRHKVVDKVRGFVKYKRQTDHYRDAKDRTKDWKEINDRLTVAELKVQAARCMDCGIPFCQSNNGCPIGNIIPKWNDLVHKGQWKDALERLQMTNNFPEFTGRVCPAPCEGACVLGINEPPVSIKSIEAAIIDKGFKEGWIVPRPPQTRTGKRVAIIGSGPAGLASADQLNKAGHTVTVYDRNDRAGGLLMYGIPNMKLDKGVVQRRIDLLKAEGVEFVLNTFIGKDVTIEDLKKSNDAVLLATGSTWPRDLGAPGRQLNGIHFAMEYLQKNTQSLLDSGFRDRSYIDPKGKNVLVIGGGDTGCDCIGTSIRHGAATVTNFELLPQPPNTRGPSNPWPTFPKVFKVDYGHAEIQAHHARDPREYQILTKEFVDDGNGNVKGVNTVRVAWEQDANGRWNMSEVPNSQEFFKAELIFLSMGFLGPEKAILEGTGIELSKQNNINTPQGSYHTNIPGVFAVGDCRRGQSLVVWGIEEGRQGAREVDRFLMGNTLLPISGGIIPKTNESIAQLSSTDGSKL
ncbi:putative glutamate synthase Glt1 [Conidiobolus coronatus NRRL 28638]|uniref:Glutamate synthase [NADH] n=1 Tax=Conidiobolus coronatus (strain ATCC 28846 / CBS 209.66 / NRRL 28638) TaxID=796925 RepID=A0A137PGW4_CONC2|nr:putative glutamate synthase Glt1 [Conidiobolus coronatus NRRL 28638]|eukprot:KXN74244.1 putative glutamate synthase Glt1 [Conidiobolus coronatus NRRL 28638]